MGRALFLLSSFLSQGRVNQKLPRKSPLNCIGLTGRIQCTVQIARALMSRRSDVVNRELVLNRLSHPCTWRRLICRTWHFNFLSIRKLLVWPGSPPDNLPAALLTTVLSHLLLLLAEPPFPYPRTTDVDDLEVSEMESF